MNPQRTRVGVPERATKATPKEASTHTKDEDVTPAEKMLGRLGLIRATIENFGGIVIDPLHSQELIRFRDGEQVGYIQVLGDEVIVKGAAINLMNALDTGGRWRAAGFKPSVTIETAHLPTEYQVIKRNGEPGAYGRKRDHEVDALLARDGSLCFLCGCELGDDITREHLVPTIHGGPDCLANMTLAHKLCNEKLGQLSVMEKLRLREAYRTMDALRRTLGHEPAEHESA